ncbi:hypothetical protein CMI37_22530 [Candidatus Pacearchaeota archaeon]|nr:hypothetical protein [Candidatus Pacearchaeota archaeon]|tara:strand:+ start:794 stop:1231 length:438 start_codon:yes stop_codon:yes gene_type:complete
MAILEGPVYWASLTVPNTTFEPSTYQATLVVDQKTANQFEKDGFKIKEIDEQPALFFRKYYNRPDGTINPPVRVVDKAKNPLDAAVGNGSKVKIQYQPRVIENKFGIFNWLELQAVQVLDLVEYNNGETDEFDILDSDGEDDIEF